jgi:hypothetical protein
MPLSSIFNRETTDYQKADDEHLGGTVSPWCPLSLSNRLMAPTETWLPIDQKGKPVAWDAACKSRMALSSPALRAADGLVFPSQ